MIGHLQYLIRCLGHAAIGIARIHRPGTGSLARCHWASPRATVRPWHAAMGIAQFNSIHPETLALPAASPTNQDRDVEADAIPVPGNQTNPQVNMTSKDSPVSKDDVPSQTLQEEKANAKFRKAIEQLEKVVSKPNAVSTIHLSLLDSSDIGNLSQMARDINMAISEFMKERDKQNESKFKATAKSCIHTVSFAGQRILGTAQSVASVGSIFSAAESRNSFHLRLAA